MDYRDSWGHSELTQHPRATLPPLTLQPGMVLEDMATGFVGAALGLKRVGQELMVGLEDRRGRIKLFPLGPGFLYEGQAVNLQAPHKAAKKTAPLVSRSGSLAQQGSPARQARASRIWVEGLHDAELLEKVWGHDLRLEGIVVEPLHGADDLEEAVRAFNPGPQRKLGVLLDHLVAGSKEAKIAQQALEVPGAAGNLLILGHPYIDIWQAIKPSRLGIKAWPTVPRQEDWKEGVLRRLGQPAQGPEDIRLAWDRILSRVDSYTDLEPALLAKVEALIDFVTLDSQTAPSQRG